MTLKQIKVNQEYQIKLSLSGYKKTLESLSITEKESQKSRISRRVFLDPKDVTLRVKSTPKGAQVYLNGKRVGETPFEGKFPRKEGTQTLTVKYKGKEKIKPFKWGKKSRRSFNIRLK